MSLAVIGMALGIDGAHIGDVAAVADGDVAQRRVIDAAVLDKAFGDFDGAVSTAQACRSVKLHSMAT